MKKTNKNSTKEYFRSALQVGEDRLLRNPSRGEQALFICVVVLAFAALIFSVITAIMSKDAMTIIRAFTENIFMFALIAALTVSDRVLVWRGRSMIIILYALLALAADAFAFAGTGGIMTVLAVVGVLAGLALYGTLLFDQLNNADKAVKYWLVYGGALYKLLYTLISVIVRGTITSEQGSVASVLAIVVIGLADVAVLLMLIYQFDGFDFAKYLLYEIISNPDEAIESAAYESTDEDVHTPERDEAVFVPYAEQDKPEDTPILDDSMLDDVLIDDEGLLADDVVDEPEDTQLEQQDDIQADEQADEQPEQVQEDIQDEVLDDFGYVPYDDDAQEDAFDNSVKTLTDEADSVVSEDTQEAYEAYEAADDDEDVLIDESVADVADDSNIEAIEDIELGEEEIAPPAKMSAQELMASLTTTERKYIKFALAYHKPADVLQVEGLSGDLFDVWVDGDVICFQNDLGQACDGRGVRTAAVAFSDVESIGAANYGGEECVVLSYYRGEQLIEIGFTKASFKNFKKVIMACM